MKDHFATIPDPRTGPAQQHELLDLLLIAVCAMPCGAESFTDSALGGRCQHDWLKTWLALPHGIPSHETFNRVFGLIAPSEFAACFQSWTQALRQAVAGELIAIDGNSPRSRLPCGGKRSAAAAPKRAGRCIWSRAGRRAIGWCWHNLAGDDKSNEIATAPPLLRALAWTGCVVTVAALNYPKNLARETSEAEADDVLARKGNHGTLPAEVKSFLDDAQPRGWHDGPHSIVQTKDKEYGRLETRRYWITETTAGLADKPHWEKLRSLGLVEREVEVDGQVQTEGAYNLSSRPAETGRFAAAVRGMGEWRMRCTGCWTCK